MKFQFNMDYFKRNVYFTSDNNKLNNPDFAIRMRRTLKIHMHSVHACVKAARKSDLTF